MSAYMPGPGDRATWGPVTSTYDPRAESGAVTFPAEIGNARADVMVTAEVWNFGAHPMGDILRVDLGCVDILDALVDSQIVEIEKAFEKWDYKTRMEACCYE